MPMFAAYQTRTSSFWAVSPWIILQTTKPTFMIRSPLRLSCFLLTAAIFPTRALDIDGGVSELELNERENLVDTSIALAS